MGGTGTGGTGTGGAGGGADGASPPGAAPVAATNEGKWSGEELAKAKTEILALVDAFVKKRTAEDAANLKAVEAVSAKDLDDTISRRQGLKSQATFDTLPHGCSGAACVFPGMAGQDNGQGVNMFGQESLNGPAAAHIAQSWDPELIYWHASMLGRIFAGSLKNAVLGPGAQVWRNSKCGRSWEYIPGEDPILGVLLVEAWTLGYNQQKVSPVLKHYINNDKEVDRMLKKGKLTVPWETQMSLYLKPFVAGSNVGASATMCGYHWLVDPGGGDPVSMCYNKRNKWLTEQSKRTWMISDYPATQMFKTYTKGIAASDSGHSWANWDPWYTELEYEHRTAKQQLTQSIGLAEEDAGHQVMSNEIGSAPRKLKNEYLQGWVGWAKELGITGTVYGTAEAGTFWKGLDAKHKEKFYEWTSRTIAESFVLLKNDGNLLPLAATDKVFLDPSCTGGQERKLTSTGSGEMSIHLLETKAETAFAGKTGDKAGAKLHLSCVIKRGGEGSDHKSIALPQPSMGDPKKTCVFVATPGSLALSWAGKAACIVVGIAPSVLGFSGLSYFVYGVVNPGGHSIMSVVANEGDLPFGDGDSKLETGYMTLQATGKKPVFEFGWGLPFGGKSWDDVAEINPAQHDRTIRRIAFCFKGKAAPAAPVPPPNPTAQFWYQIKGRKFKQLLTFVKHRGLKKGGQACYSAYYDPVTEWEGGEDGKYVPKDFALFYGLNGYSTATAWPKNQETGKNEVKQFSRADYPKHVWARHLANQRETGNKESVGRVFPGKGRTSKVVIDFWEGQKNPKAPHESGLCAKDGAKGFSKCPDAPAAVSGVAR
eukprot:g15144.t1